MPALAVAALAAALLAAALLAAAPAEAAGSRDRVRLVGSSTAFPYSEAVAEHYVGLTHGRAPVVESTGTGGGLKIFCGGLGAGFPDITGASRAITASEYRDCVSDGVADVTEALIGHDGLSLTQSNEAPELALTRRQLFLALAAEVPVGGGIVANPYRRWREIDPALPDLPIEILGPPPTSGTRDALVTLVMLPGCATFPEIAALPPERRHIVCARTREDGAFIEAGENDNIIVQRLAADPAALGIFGFSFLHENGDTLRGVPIEGVRPNVETLRKGTYPLIRPLYLYIKNAHRAVIPGMEEVLREYLSEDAIGPDGYLTERGLMPLPAVERREVRRAVEDHVPIRRFD
ncbi:phosphate ABC transporter substrate-binding protein [Amaricoccus solimangrovi]|uniref:Phosphate ABC transporter substrate-binding protein n=2 Tax=Amaricoccus solimangrovi TaxID=2589815 RepID=A0A501WZN3_9RHOB|nr:phosphate ABC transporter substrate-binding protein [Amaricoccus solimangrovi]